MSVKGFRYDGQIHKYLYDALEGAPESASGVFWATYNTTTEEEITAAVADGKAVLCKISDEVFYLTGKAAVGPSGSAWLFASVNQTSVRVTFVSGSYWNSVSTRTIPSKMSDLTNDSGFVNASGAAAAAPVQSVNGQTGTVTVNEVFWATYNVTTYADIKAADDAGKLVMLKAQVGYELPLTQINSSGAQFGVNKAGPYYFVKVTSANVWSVQTGNLVDWNDYADDVGDKTDLTTTVKTNLVAAINEINQKVSDLLPASGVSF